MLALVLLLLPNAAVLKGEVREAGTRLKLPGVAVAFGEQDTSTDAEGRFAFADLPAGPGTLVIASLRHTTLSQPLDLADNEETTVKVYVYRDTQDAFETVVLGKRDEPEVTKRTITRDEIAKVPGSYGDPLRSLQNMPGVARPPFVTGQLVIRGTAPQSSQFLLDGMPMPGLFHFVLGPSVLPERMIEDITFLPCCFSARYGGATAGVVEVKLREPDVRKVSGKASVDLGIASLFVEVPITERTSISAALRRSYYDAILPPVLRAINPRYPTILPSFWDYQLRVLHTSERAGDFSLFVFGSDDRLKLVQPPDAVTTVFNPAELSVGLFFHTVQPKWTLKLSPQVTHVLTLQGTYANSSANTPATSSAQADWIAGARDELRVRIDAHTSLLVGADIIYTDQQLTARQPAVQSVEPQFPIFPSPLLQNAPLQDVAAHLRSTRAGVYGEADFKWGHWRFVPGLRVEQNVWNARAQAAVMPRGTLKYRINDSFEVKAGTGLFQQRQASLLQSALHTTLGGVWSITQALSLEVSGFYNHLFDLQEGGTGRVYGGEVFLRHKPYKNLFAWVAYTLSRSERNGVLFDYDQTHILTLLASYALPYGFQVGTRFRLVSGNPTTEVVRAPFDADTGAYLPINGPRNAARLPLFHQLDLRVDKTFTLQTFQLNVYLDVQNVYNQKNAEFSQYAYDYSQQQFFPSLPILPILGIQGEW